MRSPYPLQWPAGWARTDARKRQRPQFSRSFVSARDHIVRQLELLGAINGMITSDLPIRADGLPYANGRCDDPGIAVWFVLDGKERVFACDKWVTHGGNLAAIGNSIQAIRSLDRWGASDLVTRVFSGFNALPPGGSPESTARPWREVLGPWPWAAPETGAAFDLARTRQLEVAKERHRALIREHHPDVGGSHERAAEINAALAEAEAELGGA